MLEVCDAQQHLRTEHIEDGCDDRGPIMAGQTTHKDKHGSRGGRNNRQSRDLDAFRIAEEMKEERAEEKREGAEKIRRVALALQKVRPPPGDTAVPEHATELGDEAAHITIELFLGRRLSQPPEAQRNGVNRHKGHQGKQRCSRRIRFHGTWGPVALFMEDGEIITKGRFGQAFAYGQPH